MNRIEKARRRASTFVLSAALSTGAAVPSVAQNAAWDFTGYLYLWGAALGGTTTTGQSIDLSFSDVVDKLDFGLMGALEARHGRISLLGDFQYLNLSDNANAAVGPGIPATADAEVKGTVFTGSIGYDVISNLETRMTLQGGFRGMDLDTTANLSVAGGSQRVSEGLQNWDVIIGVRGITQIAERWRFSYYGDIGTGDSDLTWQGSAALNYRINNWDLSFGYRYLTWDIDSSPVVSELTFSGPFVGAKIHF